MAKATVLRIDFNVSKQEPFENAQKAIMGNEHAYVMVALGTQKQLAAWKMYARAKHVDFEISNRVSAGIERYNMAVKHADDDDKDSIDIAKYIPVDLVDYYEESKKYQGIITDSKKAPCSYLLYNGNIRREIGLFRSKDNVCCLMDKNLADSHKFLKNDILKVKVVDLYYRIFDRLGMKPLSIDELREKCDPLDAAWNMYKLGATCGLNQVEQPGATSMVSRYAPTNISELCGFVAAIRPGFKSMLNTYLDRKDFEYGIPSFDRLIQTPEMPNSFVLYQEMAMETLNYAGIDMAECYAIIKAIAKKKVQEVFKRKEEFLAGFAEKIMAEEFVEEHEAQELAQQVWQILEDSSGYSFNCCISGRTRLRTEQVDSNDCVHTITLPVEEMYQLKINPYYAKCTNRLDVHKRFKNGDFGKAYSMTDDGWIIENQIVDVRFNRYADVYRVRTESGSYLDCTDNHKFPTPNGQVKLENLKIGDLLYVEPMDIKREKAVLEPIVKIEYIGKEFVYDIEMADPAHTYISETGLVTSNSHSYCVAGDSLYCAYLKAHYPLQFYECFLQIMEEDGEKDRMVETREEAKRFFKIKFPRYQWGQDNRNIKADPVTNSITNSLTSIKGFSQSVADSLYETAQDNPLSLSETFCELKVHGASMSKIEKLISIDYFAPFGNIPTVSRVFNLCQTLKFGESNTIKADKIPAFGKILCKHAKKSETSETYTFTNEQIDELKKQSLSVKKEITKIEKRYGSDSVPKELIDRYQKLCDDREQACRELVVQFLVECESLIQSFQLTDLPFSVKVQNQMDILGEIDLTTGKEADRRKMYVLAVFPLKNKATGEPWAYNIKTKSLGSGKVSCLTLMAAQYQKEPIHQNDVIYLESFFKNKKGYFYIEDYYHIFA